jgi:TonB family protein
VTLLSARAVFAADGGTGPLPLSALVTQGEARSNVAGPDDGGSVGLGIGTATGSARADMPMVTGPLDRALVQRVTRAHLGLVTKCAADHVPPHGGLSAGQVTVTFSISPAGAVSDAAVTRSAWKNAALDECLVGVVRRFRFPTPRDGGVVVVRHPFSLASTPSPTK